MLLVGGGIGATLTYAFAEGNDGSVGSAALTTTRDVPPQSLNRPTDRGIRDSGTGQIAAQYHTGMGEGLMAGDSWEMTLSSGSTEDRMDRISRLRGSEPAITPVYSDRSRYIEMNTDLPSGNVTSPSSTPFDLDPESGATIR